MVVRLSGAGIDEAQARGELPAYAAEVGAVLRDMLGAGVTREELHGATLRQDSSNQWTLHPAPLKEV